MARTSMQDRVKRLEAHLDQENPVLAGVVSSFQQLDRVARRLGLMSGDESYAAQVSWWPVIAVLGTYSAGKSTFINQYVGLELQRTGNQAVDDKFTVICYGEEEQPAVLPGLALDSDPRFPFYRISQDIEQVADGEGRRVDSYLQLKTCRSDNLRGKILIDSPGFDADQQRTSTLLITNHIIDLSDLVLVLFDARHPEPGAMADTLKHLVGDTVTRNDANKFLYVLNQIDNAAREDNPEDVVAAWQRALAQQGLTAGRFYRIYARQSGLADADPEVRERLERKRDEDLGDIERRIREVEVERAYRVVGSLEQAARHLRDAIVPQLAKARATWRRRTAWLGLATLVLLGGTFAVISLRAGHWDGLRYTPVADLDGIAQGLIAGGLLIVAVWVYFALRRLAGRWVLGDLRRDENLGRDRAAISRAFQDNQRAWWHSVASSRPRGWNRRSRKLVDKVLADADGFIQTLNDRYARPSGQGADQGRNATPGGV